MTSGKWRGWLLVLLLAWLGQVGAQDESGRINGRVVKGEEGIGGVAVLVNELKLIEVTDAKGAFKFDDVPPGNYTVILTRGEQSFSRENVFVLAGDTHTLDIEVDWDLGITEAVTVTAAAALAAKIVDAPAAVTSVPEEQIEREASHGQLPKVLEFTPGAEVTQSGLYDFNFNTRGFNSSLNRRISTYIDGRDVGVVLLGAQEWAALSSLDDLAALEFIRGPSAALYGANASSGVINMTTKSPRDSPGGLLRLTAGDLDTTSLEVRDAGEIKNGWYYKVIAGGRNTGDYTVARDPDEAPEPEYSEYCMLVGETDCLLEEKPLFRDQDNEIRFATMRVDWYPSDDNVLTIEGGAADIKGPVFQTGIGRVQILEAKRPYGRIAYSTPRWNIQGHYAQRKGNQANLTKALLASFELITETLRYGAEGQANWDLGGGRGRFVVGAAYTREEVDSTNPATGKQTVVYEPITTDREAIFSQFDWRLNDKIKFVAAGRVDWNTLHATQFSPKAAMVWSISPKHSMRLTYNQAFQVANYSEFFLHTKISNFPLAGFAGRDGGTTGICNSPNLEAPIDCDGVGYDEAGFVPILAVGNDDLQLEKTAAWEVGYSGVVASKLFFTVDYYNSNNRDFITDLIPQVGTSLGTLEGCVDENGAPQTDRTQCPVNPDYLNWVGPDDWENTDLVFFNPFGPDQRIAAAQALRNAVDRSVGGASLGFRLAQDLDSATVVVGRTYANVGTVDTQGVDFGMQYFISNAFRVQASYSWFDFTILDDNQDVEDILLPNTPEHKASLSISYNRTRWGVTLSGRWVDAFRWSAGVFQGDVPSYTTGDLGAFYAFTKHVSVGVNIANVGDNVHRQTFGGDLLSRRALAHVAVSW